MSLYLTTTSHYIDICNWNHKLHTCIVLEFFFDSVAYAPCIIIIMYYRIQLDYIELFDLDSHTLTTGHVQVI